MLHDPQALAAFLFDRWGDMGHFSTDLVKKEVKKVENAYELSVAEL